METVKHFEGLLADEQQNAAALARCVREHAEAWREQPDALRTAAQSYGRAVGRVAELEAIVGGLRRRAQEVA